MDVKQYISQPSEEARYEIYRQSYLNLLECGLVTHTQSNAEVHEISNEQAEIVSFVNSEVPDEPATREIDILPPYHIMRGRCEVKEDSIPYRLWQIAGISDVRGPTNAG